MSGIQKTHFLLFFFAACVAMAGCSMPGARLSKSKAELRAIQKEQLENASRDANDYSTCMSLSAVAYRAKKDMRLLEKVEVIQADCQPKLDQYRKHWANYLFSLAPNDPSHAADRAADELRQQMRGMVIKTLME